MLLILIALIVSATLYLFLLKPNKHWRVKCVPYVEPTLLFGSMKDIIMQKENVAEFMSRVYHQFKEHRYVGIHQFTRPILLIRDLELIKQIAIKDSDSLVDHLALSSEDIDPLWSRNLLSSKGEKWRHLRTALSPSFTANKMKSMIGLISDCADSYVQYFLDKTAGEDVHTLDIKDAFTRFTNDVIATCAFGVQCDSLRDRTNDFFMAGRAATDQTGLKGLKFFLFPFCPSIVKAFNMKIINDEVGNFFRGIISETMRIREEQKIVRPDMIQLMMELRDKLGRDVMTNEDVTAQALIFFFAGFESAAILMSFVAYELACNPDVQERLKREVDDTLKENGGKITYDSLMGMKYLDMVVTETLRKWPPTPMTDRLVTKPHYMITPERSDEVGVQLDENDSVWFPIYAIHHDPEYFPEPERFDPERFNEENKNASMKAFLPFGLGPRNCIGSRFVLMENKAIIVKLLQKFQLVPVEKTNIPMKLDKAQFSLHSLGGWWLGLKKRQTS